MINKINKSFQDACVKIQENDYSSADTKTTVSPTKNNWDFLQIIYVEMSGEWDFF